MRRAAASRAAPGVGSHPPTDKVPETLKFRDISVGVLHNCLHLSCSQPKLDALLRLRHTETRVEREYIDVHQVALPRGTRHRDARVDPEADQRILADDTEREPG